MAPASTTMPCVNHNCFIALLTFLLEALLLATIGASVGVEADEVTAGVVFTEGSTDGVDDATVGAFLGVSAGDIIFSVKIGWFFIER